MITAEQLGKWVKNPEDWIDVLNEVMEFYEINNELRVASFLANAIHESAGMSRLTENLNYSADGLKRVFPKYFRTVNPAEYARKPEMIANRVYAGRYGNGDEESGDGWRYRGRGIFQLTFHDNYEACGNALGIDLVNEPDLLTEPKFAAWSAGWYWVSRNLNEIADTADQEKVCRKINGGTHGLEERVRLFNEILSEISEG